MKVFSEEKLLERLTALGGAHRVAFAVSTCERIFPNYEAFVAEEGAGDPAGLRESLDLLWTSVEHGGFHEKRLRVLLERAEGSGPNDDDFSGFFSNLAREVSIAVCLALECALTPDPKRASLPTHHAMESISFYLVNVGFTHELFMSKAEIDADPRAESDHTDAWINSSPLMLAELQAQDEDLAALQATPVLTPELLRAMRERSQKRGIQPFDRGLVRREAIPTSPRPVPPPFECPECEGCGHDDGGGECAECGGCGRVRTLTYRSGTRSA